MKPDFSEVAKHQKAARADAKELSARFCRILRRINSKVILSGSIRYDFWRNFAALNSVRTLSTNVVNTLLFPDRTESALSPQGSVLFQATENLSFHALASKSFRAPTLNELYEDFASVMLSQIRMKICMRKKP